MPMPTPDRTSGGEPVTTSAASDRDVQISSAAEDRREPPLHPALESHRRDIREIRQEAERLTAGLSEEQARWQPAPDRWSVSDCFAHLNLAEDKTMPALTRAIEEAQEARDPDAVLPESFRHGFLGNLFVRMLEPPPRFRVRAPAGYAPVAGERSFGEIRTRFDELRQQRIRTVEACRGLHLGRVRMASPSIRLVRLSLGQWFDFLAVHDRRHLWQARQVIEHTGFPRS